MATQISTFLSEYPLYKPFKLFEVNGPNVDQAYPDVIRSNTFTYYCEAEGIKTTFHLGYNEYAATQLNRIGLGGDKSRYLDEGRNFEYSLLYVGRCQSCKNYKIDLLLRIWGDKPIPVSEYRTSTGRGLGNDNDSFQEDVNPADYRPEPVTIFIEKTGIYPSVKLDVNKQVERFFDRESKGWYYKGIKALSENLGIGAFAYFRRIIEKELIHIVQDLATLPSSNSNKINEFLSEYAKSKKPHLIYENVYGLLPESLKSLPENPLMLLYKQTSDGLHNLTDEKCLERAESINRVLVYVIKKINEERSEIFDIRESIKRLKEEL